MEDLHLYFNPSNVIDGQLYAAYTIGEYTKFNTGNWFNEWEDVDIAIFGLDDFSRGVSDFDYVRNEFYNLFTSGYTPKIYDLGNLKLAENENDSFEAISYVVSELLKINVVPVMVGGEHHYTFPLYKAYKKNEQTINLLTVDNKLDFNESEKVDTDSFLKHITLDEPNYLFNYTNIGHQTYFTNPLIVDLVDKLYFDAIRLGEVQKNINLTEPLIRNSDLISISFNSIRNCEALSQKNISPNGFYGNEVCQLARYAGISDKVSLLSIHDFEFKENNDNKSSKQLLAQILWCFVDGYYNRKGDNPSQSESMITYRIPISSENQELNFIKSKKSDRWWLKVPYPPSKKSKFERHHLVPCNYSDYQLASSNELPDIWWKTYRKLNNI